ncbi:Fic family protein [Salinactinospora qingdaonensis]|uniref:Uncharacterized protein n=1 Tax=Salinactinospora qingdaonensis TaxID=702744 RepID=A0ABP7FMV2_9ACTN
MRDASQPPPRQDGRVARALMLLSLQRGHYAPITVGRTRRSAYISALDEANAGDLRPLVRFFARLEEQALRAEMQAPLSPVAQGTGAVAIARAYASRLKAREIENHTVKRQKGTEFANAPHRYLTNLLNDLAGQVSEAFKDADPQARASVDAAAPQEEKATYWKGQLAHAAKLADFYANLAEGAWWVRLHLRMRGYLLRFITAVQKVGHGETGVLALTCYAEVLDVSSDSTTLLWRVFDPSNLPDSVTFVYTDDADARWAEVTETVDAALSVAIRQFAEDLP